MTDNIKLPPFPDGMCLREDIEDYARAAIEADRQRRTPPNEPFAIVIDRLYDGEGPSLAYWNGENYQFTDGDCYEREGDTLDGYTAEFLTDYQLEERLFDDRKRKGVNSTHTFGEPVDKGPWKAGVNRNGKRTFIESDDFTHDVRLYVDGDFADQDEKLAYALGIADQLNAAPQPAEQQPAEAQTMPDWGAAPPGATHYQPHQDAYYKRVSASEWYVWSRVEDRELLRWLPSPGTSDSAEWVVRPTDAMPPPSAPVGVRCGECRGTGEVCTGTIDGTPELFDCDRCGGTGNSLAQQPASAAGVEGWFLPASSINSLQRESVDAQIKRCKAAHFTNLDIRINGQNEVHEADWIKHMVKAAAPKPDAVAGLVEKALDRMRHAPPQLWRADLIGQQISVERMRDILAFALAHTTAPLQAEVEALRAEVNDTIRELRIEQANLAAANERLREVLETCLEMEERPKVIELARAALAAHRKQGGSND